MRRLPRNTLDSRMFYRKGGNDREGGMHALAEAGDGLYAALLDAPPPNRYDMPNNHNAKGLEWH